MDSRLAATRSAVADLISCCRTKEHASSVAPRNDGHSNPRPRRLGLFLEARDLRALGHGQADIVQALEQAVLAARIDLELDDAAVGAADFLLFHIDRQRRIGAALGVVEKLLYVRRRDLHRKNAVLEAVVLENVAERGRDHAGDAEILQRPGRMLAR